MDFSRSDEQELLIENLHDLLSDVATESYVRECYEKREYPEKVMEALRSSGFYMLGLPEEYGGTPVDMVTYFMAIEEFSRFLPPCGWPRAGSFNEMLVLGTDEQKRLCADLTKEGKIAFSFCISEPGAGSDNNAMTTTATRRNGKVYINGQKTFCTFGAEAPYMLVATRDAEADPRSNVTFWLFPKDLPGITVTPIDKIGWHMATSCDVFFDDVEIEEENMVGPEGAAFPQLKKNFEMERLTNCAMVLGMARTAYEDAASYAASRVQFGKPIGSYQLIQEKLTYMAIMLRNMSDRLYHVAWLHDQGEDIQFESALAKLYCVESAFRVADDAMQIMGGVGWTEDCRISRLWRDIRAYQFTDGTNQIMVHIAGRKIVRDHTPR